MFFRVVSCNGPQRFTSGSFYTSQQRMCESADFKTHTPYLIKYLSVLKGFKHRESKQTIKFQIATFIVMCIQMF